MEGTRKPIRKTSRQCGGFFNDRFRDMLPNIVAMRELHMSWPVISDILGRTDKVLSERTRFLWAAAYSDAKREGILPSTDSPEVVACLEKIKNGMKAIFSPKQNPHIGADSDTES